MSTHRIRRRHFVSDALAAEKIAVLYAGPMRSSRGDGSPARGSPNIRPASAVLRASGRASARVLDDWADHGYPVERG